MSFRHLIFPVFLISLPAAVVAQTVSANLVPASPKPAERVTWKNFKLELVKTPFRMTYSRQGLEIKSRKGGYTAHIQWRLQPRFSTPFDDDPHTVSQFSRSNPNHYSLRRSRYKMDGAVLGGLVTYKYEHDFIGHQMIDLYADLNLRPWLRFRIGQWKSIFSQERYISSGRQQMVERSIVNREFTFDRQAGFSLYGRIAAGKRGDSFYAFELLTGNGLNTGINLDRTPLLTARYQWNFLKADPGFSSSDTGNRKTPAAFIAFSAARNTSAFTRYSGSGGGQLDGFLRGAPNQYRLSQLNAEFMYKYRGLSIQAENHWKQIRDQVLFRTTTLRGAYVQGGYFPHNVVHIVPREIEFAYRYAFVDPSTRVARDLRQEHSIAMNVFLEGHDNKFTFEVSRLGMQHPVIAGLHRYRYQIQWDVQF